MSKNQLSSYKFIISSGCSYGRMVSSLSTHRDMSKHNQEVKNLFNGKQLESNGDVILINLSVSSQGSEWQSDSSIYVVNQLLELGVPKENIYVFIQWSQWSRYTTHNWHFLKLDLSELEFNKDFGNDTALEFVTPNDFSNEVKDILLKKLDIRQGINPQNAGRIGSLYYSTPDHLADNTYEKYGDEYVFWHNECVNLTSQTPIDLKIKKYIDNILKTQWFLKSNNISYNFISMQSDFFGWHRDNDLNYHFITHTSNEERSPYTFENNKIVINKKNLYYIKNLQPIENIFTSIKPSFDLIDFSNFYQYNLNGFKRGGIDEWAIDTFKESGYCTFETRPTELNPEVILPNYGYHPNVILYALLWNEAASNCTFLKLNNSYQDWVIEKYWEDYYYDNGSTKNRIGVSKSYMENELNKQS